MSGFLEDRKGQLTVVGLLLVFLGLMVLSSLMDTIADTSTNMSNNLTSRGYVEEGVLARLVPMFVLVVYLATVALYGSPQT